MSAEARLLVRQQKGMAGRPWTQRLVLKGLGLRGPGSEVVVANERAIRGMIRKVLHLVSVEEVSVEGVAVQEVPAEGGKAPAVAGKKAAAAPAAKAGATKKVKS